MELYGNECEAEVHRSIENQLCLQVRLFESAMTQPGFARKRKRMLLEAQNTYWGALLTMMAMQKPDPERFAPIHAELRRLRATLTAFKM